MENKLWVKNRDETFYSSVKKIIPFLNDCRPFYSPYVLNRIEPWAEKKSWQFLREELEILDGSVARNETVTLRLLMSKDLISSFRRTDFFFHTYPLLTQILSKISLRFNQYIVAMGRLDLLDIDSKVRYGHLIQHARTQEDLFRLLPKKKSFSADKILSRIIDVDNTYLFMVLVKTTIPLEIRIDHIERCIRRKRKGLFHLLISYPQIPFPLIQQTLLRTTKEDNLEFFSVIYDKVVPVSQLHYLLLTEAIKNKSIKIYKRLLSKKKFSRPYESRIMREILTKEDQYIDFLKELFNTGYHCNPNYLPSLIHQAMENKCFLSVKVIIEAHTPILNPDLAFVVTEDIIKNSPSNEKDVIDLLEHYGSHYDRFSIISLLSFTSNTNIIRKLNEIL